MREAEAREIREREERERAARERPLREAEEAYKSAATEMAKLTREKILSGIDDEAFISPELVNARMTTAAAKKFNLEQAELFRENNPRVSDADIDALAGYFERNHLRIIDAQMIKAAWDRLSSYGLLEAAPVPEPQTPEPQTIPVLSPEPEPVPETYEGWDPDTGERKIYTKWDVDRMTSEQYRRVFRIYREHLRLPNRPAF